jgi:branched-chain amino acid transport system ATP-binding protein
MVRFLKNIKEKEGIAVIAMVEHIMRAVVNFAERVIVLNQGKKILDAPTAQALSDSRVIDVYLGRESEDKSAC